MVHSFQTLCGFTFVHTRVWRTCVNTLVHTAHHTSITRNDIAATRCFCCTNTLQNRILNTETSPFLVPFTNDATHKVFVLGGDFSLGEIRLVTNPATKLKVYMPVVGQPRPDFQEKYVDHGELSSELLVRQDKTRAP